MIRRRLTNYELRRPSFPELRLLWASTRFLHSWIACPLCRQKKQRPSRLSNARSSSVRRPRRFGSTLWNGSPRVLLPRRPPLPMLLSRVAAGGGMPSRACCSFSTALPCESARLSRESMQPTIFSPNRGSRLCARAGNCSSRDKSSTSRAALLKASLWAFTPPACRSFHMLRRESLLLLLALWELRSSASNLSVSSAVGSCLLRQVNAVSERSPPIIFRFFLSEIGGCKSK